MILQCKLTLGTIIMHWTVIFLLFWFQGDNVILLVNVNWSSSKFTRKLIVNWNVWPTWRSDIATAVPSTCLVSVLLDLHEIILYLFIHQDLKGHQFANMINIWIVRDTPRPWFHNFLNWILFAIRTQSTRKLTATVSVRAMRFSMKFII